MHGRNIAKRDAANDGYARCLSRLCKQTQEGYMISIDQRVFEGRDTYIADSGGDRKMSVLNDLELQSQLGSVLSPRTELVMHTA